MALILVVDDEPMTAEMLSTFVRLIGHESVEAYSSRQAWERLESAQPDAILLDIMLPDISGLDTCRQIRQQRRWATIPIIMISAMAPPMQQEAANAGASAYMSKPINLQQLRSALESVGITA